MSSEHPDNPLAGGEQKIGFSQSASSEDGSLYHEYLCCDYCFSCAYFTRSKGHFGACRDKPNTYYDGTVKGTGCALWRITSLWSDTPYSPHAGITRIPSMVKRRRFTKHRKPLCEYFQKYWRKYSDIQRPKCIGCGSNHVVKYGNRVTKYRGYTSHWRCVDCHKRFSTGDRIKGKFPQPLVDSAVAQLRRGATCPDTVAWIRENEGMDISVITVYRWGKDAGVQLHPNGSHKSEVRQRIREGVNRYYAR